eukprot:scaffold54549_cov48-Attheya_sp.AAC.2
MQSIKWQACEGAARLLGVGLRFWKTKHVTGIFANGKWMHRWKFWMDSNCPRCGQPNEDAVHIIQCPEVNPLWTKAIEPLQAWMEKALTPPDVCAVILEELHAWRTSSPSRVQPDHCTQDLVEAIAVQSSIGWGGFMEGFLAANWESVLDNHYEELGSRRSGRRWCAGIIHRLWLLLRDLWEHRNAILHDHVPAAIQQASAQLNASISGQYNQGLDGLFPPHFRSYFTRPLADILALSVTFKQHWLANPIAARDQLQAEFHLTADNRAQEQRALQQWLDLPRFRRPRACRLRPAATSTTPGAPVPTLQRRRKRKRSRSALPENYTFVPLSR